MTLRLSEPENSSVDAVAASEHRSKNDVVREAVRFYMANRHRSEARDALLDELLTRDAEGLRRLATE